MVLSRGGSLLYEAELSLEVEESEVDRDEDKESLLLLVDLGDMIRNSG